MQKRNINKSLLRLWIILLIPLTLIIFFFIYRFTLSAYQTSQVKYFAQQIGIEKANLVLSYQNCWDIFSATCGEVLLYETTLSKSQVDKNINSVSDTPVNPAVINMYSALEIPSSGSSRLQIPSTKDGDGNVLIAWKWLLVKEGKRYVVSFLESSRSQSPIRLDGKPINSNIVRIHYY